MDGIEIARRTAARLHSQAVARGADAWNSYQLVLNEASHRDLVVEKTNAGGVMLNKARATFIAQDRLILHERECSEFEQAFLVAHELGHVVLGDDPISNLVEGIDPARSADPSAVGMARVTDYSHRQRREVQMDLFAREFLLPRSVVRDLHLVESLSAAEIADRLCAPHAVVAQQLFDALLLPLIAPPTLASSATKTPNPQQINAAEINTEAYLLSAGPGTGKTQTLIGRVQSLLTQGVDPRRILLLTFSNKAAGEMSRRIAETNTEAAAAMWIGTFHSFGLDLIRRFHQQFGTSSNPRLMDKADAVECLVEEFPRFALKHYHDLYDPTGHIENLLSAISRAKDEVVDPEGYQQLAEYMVREARSDEEKIIAEKAMEVAQVYREYEILKSEAGCLDYGDLVMLPVKLLEDGDSELVDQLRSSYDHILVDEYQDVNRSSVRLLHALHNEGAGGSLWAVGDSLQSIYRFRGASSFNVALFGQADFPHGKQGRLEVNYRSAAEITCSFTAFAETMSQDGTDSGLSADRGEINARPELRLVPTADQLSADLAENIEVYRTTGYAYRDQAILCSGNEKLALYAEDLERLGIPVLFLGSLFERPEIKDMISLLLLLIDRRATGLLRVASMPQFSMPFDDVTIVLEALSDDHLGPGEWLLDTSEIEALSPEGRASLVSIADALKGFSQNAKAWDVLSVFLLDRSRLAAELCQSDAVPDRTKGIALWQFLNFIKDQPTEQGLPIQRLCDRIRRMVRLGDDRDLRQLPQAANGIDAVRLMTIHGAKGLEFPVVHLPGLNGGTLPRAYKAMACPPPVGLIQGANADVDMTLKSGHEEEQACLFYVALSRAQDRLTMYAVEKNARGHRRPLSPYIKRLDSHIDRVSCAPTTCVPAPKRHNQVDVKFDGPLQFSGHQLSLYERCPRRFFYTYIANTGGRRASTPFTKTHDAVRRVVAQIVTARMPPTAGVLSDLMRSALAEEGLQELEYASSYHAMAMAMVNYLVSIRKGHVAESPSVLKLRLGSDVISILPDDILVGPDGNRVDRRIVTRHSRKSQQEDVNAAALQLSVQEAFPGATVESVYLSDESIETLDLTPRKLDTREAKLKTHLVDIRSGHFPPNPSVRMCTGCPAFFICGPVPLGSIQKKFH